MKEAETLTPLLCSAKIASKLCGCGLSLWYELDAAGKVPQAAHLNSKKLWSYEQLQVWSKNNCPHRESEKWQRLLKTL